jgi:hypothetical protein
MHLHDEAKESNNIELLITLMDGSVDHEVARRVLRKFDGDVEKAASAMIEGDRGEDTQSSLWSSHSQMEINQPRPLPPPAIRPNSPINIDLTGDDDHNDELSRALKASLETASQEGPMFGPSKRPADANWAMVPSNVGQSVLHFTTFALMPYSAE